MIQNYVVIFHLRVCVCVCVCGEDSRGTLGAHTLTIVHPPAGYYSPPLGGFVSANHDSQYLSSAQVPQC